MRNYLLVSPTRSGGCVRTTLSALLAVYGFLCLQGVLATQSHAQPRRVSASEDEPAQERSTESAPSDEPDTTSTSAPISVYVIAVPLEDGLDAVAQRAGSAARASLRTIPNVDWQHADRLFLGYDESALTTLSRARERLDAGRAAYLNLDLPEAISQLEGAVADFDSAAAALEDPHDLGEALLLLGASLSFENRARDAVRVFGRLHVQMPQVIPDPNVFRRT